MIQIDVTSFNGPMDLLLELIAKSKIDIYQIAISEITEDFLEAMQILEIPPDELSDFIRMASILVHIKARALLQDQEEDGEELPSQEELIARLQEYRLYKRAAGLFFELAAENQGIRTRFPEDLSRWQKQPEPIPSEASALVEAVLAMLYQKKTKQETEFAVERILNLEEYSVEEMAGKIREKLLSGKHFTFFDLIRDLRPGRSAVIVAFLSLLELTRTNGLSIAQNPATQEISVDVVDANALTERLASDTDYEGKSSPEKRML